MHELLDDFLSVSRNLTKQQVTSARFWDNKFRSLSLIQVYTGTAWGLNDFEVTRVGLGDIISQYDAILVAWKEKRLHDLTRLTTMIRSFFAGKNISAYVNEIESPGVVLGDEYEPVLRVMPHSEFPSGSTLICTAFFEHQEMFAKTRPGGDIVLPVRFPIFPNITLFPLDGPAFVDLPSFKGAAEQCSISRLWAGVHFRPSGEAAQKLGIGIVKRAFEFVGKLVAGKVPEECTHCIKF